jgi:Protein of unknown function (DUF3108)
LQPFALPPLSLRRAGAAASAAAFLVFVLILAFVTATDAVAGDTGRQGGIQGGTKAGTQLGTQTRLEAEYVVTLAGIPIGRGNWIIELSDDKYSAAASGTTTGIIRFFTGARGTGAARGTVNAGQPVPTSYDATLAYDHKIDDVRILLTGGNVTDYDAEPPLPPIANRIPVTDADRRGVMDPMTSMLNRVTGTGDPVSPEACNRKVAVFDGRVRYDLHSEFKRMDNVKADRGYEGPAVVCAVYFTPIAGYVPDRPAIRYLVTLRDAEVWLAPIEGTRVLVPFRFSMPTPLGAGLLEATEFVTVAQPSQSQRPSAKTE